MSSALRMDPTRTATLRRRFEEDISKRFKWLKRAIVQLVAIEDCFGLLDKQDEVTDNYNPSQPRDYRGRWTTGGGSVTAPSNSQKVIDAVNSAIDELETHQLSSPNEKRIVIDGDTGEVLANVEGLPDQVDIAEHLGKMLGKNVIDLHTHPDASSMSDGDWGMFAWSHVKELYVVSKRDIYSLRKTEAWDTMHHTERNPRVIKDRWNAIVDKITEGDNWTAESAILDTNRILAKEFKVEFTSYPRGSETPVTNKRFRFLRTREQVEAYRKWLASQVDKYILVGSSTQAIEQGFWDQYVMEGYKKGAGRAFDESQKMYAKGYAADGSTDDFYQGSKYEFLKSSFGQSETVEKIQLLAGRVYTDLKGVTDQMAASMSRTLVDGLSQGQGAMQIADSLVRDADLSENRARMVARTEIMRAHAEGALDAMERMGIEEVGVMVEWSTAGHNVCKLCQALEGIVLTVKEAKGMFPRHPNCKCTPIPANVGENQKGQKRSKAAIEKALDTSIDRERPKTIERTLEEQRKRSGWTGADLNVAKDRPKSFV